MPLALLGLIFIGVASLAAAGYVFVVERYRRGIVGRTSPVAAERDLESLFGGGTTGGLAAFLKTFRQIVPEGWVTSAKTEEALVQAGYDGPTAPLTYASIRVLLLISIPLMVMVVAPKDSFSSFVLYVAAGVAFALILPIWYLVRKVRLRQERLRRSLPDALDLLVVCIEAGISLDAALLRVAKDLDTVHPELAREFLVVNRKANAGMAREDALRGLVTRTGVKEVRALVSHVIQGEKWGTSSGKILRVYSETLRRQRRQSAEKRAATAPVKMLIPLGAFIFPAILLVIMGPIILNVMDIFKK